MDGAANGEIAFFQLAATLIPLLLFSGVVAERTASIDAPSRRAGVWRGALLALVLGGIGIAAEVISLRALIRGSAEPFWLGFVACILVLSLALVVGFAIWAWFNKAAKAESGETTAAAEETKKAKEDAAEEEEEEEEEEEPSQTSQPCSKLKLETTALRTVSVILLTAGVALGTIFILHSAHSMHRTEVKEKELEKKADDATLEVQLLEGDLERTTMRQIRMLASVRSDDHTILTLEEKMRFLKRDEVGERAVLWLAHRKWVEESKASSDQNAENRLTAKIQTLVGKLSAERSTLRGLSKKKDELLAHEGA
jgi:type III secretory pathway component EscV